jgi:hypothetical protein
MPYTVQSSKYYASFDITWQKLYACVILSNIKKRKEALPQFA